MPVTRNSVGNSKSGSEDASTTATTTIAAAATKGDDAATESGDVSKNSNEGDRNETPEGAPTRTLRDRASLAAKTAIAQAQQQMQQHQPQHLHQQRPRRKDASKSKSPDASLLLTKQNPSKSPLPTRILSRRSSFRPQSLLKRDQSDDPREKPSQPSKMQVPSKNTNEQRPSSNPPSKKPRREEPSRPHPSKAQETQGLDLTKRPAVASSGTNRSQGMTLSRPNNASSSLINKSNASTSSLINKSNVSSSSLVKKSNVSSSSLINRSSASSSLINKSNPSPRVSLPGNPTTISSHVPTNLNGSQAVRGHKTYGLFPLPPLGARIADEIRARMGTASTLSSPNNSMNSSTTVKDPRANQSLLLPGERRQEFNVLVAVTGSVATVKLIDIIRKLHQRFPQTYLNKATGKQSAATISVKVIMTEHSKHFVNKTAISKCVQNMRVDVFDDADEWTSWTKMGDPVLHIELRKWADLLLIAPLDANTMAKLANGLCDNLVTCVVRAWDSSKRLIYCPAMNTHMWNHAITKEQLLKLQSFGYSRIDPIEKTLACGDTGPGAMATIDTIVERVVESLLRPVPRLISPTKPLLTQQPTYQIFSTSDKQQPAITNNTMSYGSMSTSSSAVNLMSRFNKANDQVTRQRNAADSFNNSNRSSSFSGTPMSFLKSSTPQSPSGFTLLHATKQQHPRVTGAGAHDKSNHSATNNLKQSGPTKSNQVQSLKNLQVVNPDLSMTEMNGVARPNEFGDDDESDSDEDNEDGDGDDLRRDNDDDDDMDIYIEESGLDLSSPEADNYGHDLDAPSLMEASLTINDDPTQQQQQQQQQQNGRPTRGGSLNSFGNLTSASANNEFNTVDSNAATTNGPFSSVFNTTKFLDACYVEQRNCFNCAICKNDYKNRKSLSRHLREQHVQGNVHKCEPCGIGFKRREKLMKHKRDTHGIPIDHLDQDQV